MRIAITAVTLALGTVAIIGATVFGAARAADDNATVAGVGLGPGSALWLQGTSNVHDFEARSTQVHWDMTRDRSAGTPTDPAGVAALIRNAMVRGIDVDVPVTSLHSGKGGLDKNMYKALKADQNPAIHFHMGAYKLGAAQGDTLPIQASGTLAIAGATRPVELSARAWATSQGVRLEGAQPLRMTEYDIKPPTMMLGAMRVNDHVTVHF